MYSNVAIKDIIDDFFCHWFSHRFSHWNIFVAIHF